MAKKRGRPTEYNPKFALWAASLSRQGMTEKEIAKSMGIGLTTLRRWRLEYDEFRIAIKESKGIPDAEIEAALYKRAIGYEIEEVKIISIPKIQPGKDKKSATSAVATKIEKTVKHVVPDVTAQIFWLKNRMPEQWRDVKKTEHSGTIRTLADIMADGENSES